MSPSMSSTEAAGDSSLRRLPLLVSAAVAAAAFLVLYGPTLQDLFLQWWSSPDYHHGFLLAPIAAWLAWDRRVERPSPDVKWGLAVLAGAVGLFLAGTVAAELFTQRVSAVAVLAGLVLYYLGREQLRAWWLPFALLLFTIPIPEVVLGTVTLPLQLFASKVAVELMEFRRIPVLLSGNVIRIPGQELFVAEACSGLRSLSALFGLTLLFGGTGLAGAWSRVALMVVALPAALAANAFRVFATGYLGYYFGEGATEGAMHQAAGLAVFVMALGGVLLVMKLFQVWERRRRDRRAEATGGTTS